MGVKTGLDEEKVWCGLKLFPNIILICGPGAGHHSPYSLLSNGERDF